ncbi:MAG: hypothetical protein RQ752_05815 [Thermohalobaculum sp.]|nr:hypothetical protein [Thermohalobaculum sp.]
MTKHIIDKPAPHDDGARAKAYTKIERETGNPADSEHVQAMHRQPRARDDGHRAVEFTKIERGEGED